MGFLSKAFKAIGSIAGPAVAIATGNPALGALAGGIGGAVGGGGIQGMLGGALGALAPSLMGLGGANSGMGALGALFGGGDVGGELSPATRAFIDKMQGEALARDYYGMEAAGEDMSQYVPPQKSDGFDSVFDKISSDPLSAIQLGSALFNQHKGVPGGLTPKQVLDDLQRREEEDRRSSQAFMQQFNNPQPFRRQTPALANL